MDESSTEVTRPGSYDDIPDSRVSTVLNVPIRLDPPATANQSTKRGGRHARPKEEARPPQAQTPAVVPYALTYESGSTDLLRATLKVGGISAGIVFSAVALVLTVFAFWQP